MRLKSPGSKHFARRQFSDQIPSCGGESNDPTWWPAQSVWKDNVKEGQGMPGVRIFDSCYDNTNNNNCWTGYYFVQYETYYDRWQPIGSLTCATNSDAGPDGEPATETCSLTGSTAEQQCFTLTKGTEVGAEASFTGSEFFSFSVTQTELKSWQTCTTSTVQAQCDRKVSENNDCTALYKANLVTRVYGYMARQCTAEKSGEADNGRTRNIQDPGIKGGDGRYTRGTRDFEFNLYGNLHFDCNEVCVASDPESVPKPDIERPGRHWWGANVLLLTGR